MNYIYVSGSFCVMLHVLLIAAESPPEVRRLNTQMLPYYENPLPNECGACINPQTRRYDNIYQGLECMRLGYKHVYWGFENDMLLPTIPTSIKKLSLQSLIFKGHLILYTKEGEGNALRLQKYCEEKDANALNHYLVGSLLGYAEEDLKYFYQRGAIFTPLQSILEDRVTLPYAHLTPEEQKQFDTLSNTTTWKYIFEKDKHEAGEWLSKH